MANCERHNQMVISPSLIRFRVSMDENSWLSKPRLPVTAVAPPVATPPPLWHRPSLWLRKAPRLSPWHHLGGKSSWIPEWKALESQFYHENIWKSLKIDHWMTWKLGKMVFLKLFDALTWDDSLYKNPIFQRCWVEKIPLPQVPKNQAKSPAPQPHGSKLQRHSCHELEGSNV